MATGASAATGAGVRGVQPATRSHIEADGLAAGTKAGTTEDDLARRVVAASGQVIKAPRSVVLRRGDYVVPTCEDGLAQSQVLHQALLAMSRVGGFDVARPHGALSGCDPHVGYLAVSADNFLDFLYVPSDDYDDDGSPWSSRSFANVFGTDKASRFGQGNVTANGLRLNPVSTQKHDLRKLSADRSAQRAFMDREVYDASMLRSRLGKDGRAVFLCFDRAAQVVMQRLLEVSGEAVGSLAQVYVVTLPALPPPSPDSSPADNLRTAYNALLDVVHPHVAGSEGKRRLAYSSSSSSDTSDEDGSSGSGSTDDSSSQSSPSSSEEDAAAHRPPPKHARYGSVSAPLAATGSATPSAPSSGSAEGSDDDTVLATIRHRGASKEVVLFAGLDPSELRDTLQSSFGITDQHIVGIRNTAKGIVYPLSLLSQAPYYFAADEHQTSQFELMVSDGEGSESDSVTSSQGSEVLAAYVRGAAAGAGADTRAAAGGGDGSRGRGDEGTEAAAASLGAVGLGGLDDFRSITGFGLLSAAEVFDALVVHAEDGLLDRRAFVKAVATLRSDHGLSELDEVGKTVCDALFDAFDVNDDGVVDVSELGCGLSVLCDGTDAVRAAFYLLDADRDGRISIDEFVMYLRAVFTVIFKSMTAEQQAEIGATVEQLATSTAERCFDEAAGTNADGTIDYDAFARWITSPSGTLSQAASSAAPVPDWMSLSEARRLTQLRQYSVEEVVDVFAGLAGEDETLGRDAFQAAFAAFLDESDLSALDRTRAHIVIDRLYELFDTDGNGVVDFSELATGLTVLAGGSQEEKLRVAFALYDLDGDQYITLDEMTSYLTAVFKVMYETRPHIASETGVSPEVLARVTTQQCFKDADVNLDGKLSFDEFRSWYELGGLGGVGDDGAAQSDAAVVSRVVVDEAAGTPATSISVQEMRALTGLAAHPVDAVIDVFAEAADDRGLLSWDAFSGVMREFIPEQTPAQMRRTETVMRIVFDAFDADDSGAVDFDELAAGLTTLCGGTQEDKVDAAFSLYDFDGDGYITREEMVRYLTAVFKMMYNTQPEARDAMDGATPEDLATATVEHCFATADLNKDGRLSRDEFRHWYVETGAAVGGDPITAAVNAATADVDGASDGAGAGDGEGGAGPGVGTSGAGGGAASPSSAGAAETVLQKAHRITNLSHANVDDVLDTFASATDSRATLSEGEFIDCFRQFLASPDDAYSAEVTEALAELFDVFDTDRNGVVDFTELAAGLSVLCGGSRDDKVEAAFALYDLDGDGFISLEEMQMYLTSVFRMLMVTNPEVYASVGGVSPEELARATAQQCFDDADTDGDGRVSLAEFREWTDRSGGAGVNHLVVDSAPEAAQDLSWVSLAEVRRLTSLENYDAADVMDEFANVASADSLIDRAAFDRAMSRFVNPRTEQDAARVAVVLDRLFKLFDADGSGAVDFAELASGLSVLCGGSPEDKVQAAFELYDFNGDGFIDRDEMVLYLTSVFKVLFETQPDTHTAIGVDAAALAEATTDSCFAEADLNHDGRLSFDEFKAWYLQGGAGPGNQLTASNTRFTVMRAAQPSWMSIEEVKRVTDLSSWSVDDMLRAFASVANADGLLDRRAFRSGFNMLVVPKSAQDEARLQVVQAYLFDLFDADGNGVVDFSELASGLSVLTAGTPDRKIDAGFSLYDANGNGYITQGEMVLYLASVYKVLFETHPGTQEAMGVTPEELAHHTAEACFAEMARGDGRITLAEFKRWMSEHASSQPAAAIEDAMGASGAYVHRAGAGARGSGWSGLPAAPVWLNLHETKRLLCLHNQSVVDVFEVLAAGCDEAGLVPHDDFVAAMARLIPAHTGEDAARAYIICDRIFTVLAHESSSDVDFVELASGMSVLCGGTREDKVESVFAMFGDSVTRDELTLYLTAVFNVLFACEPHATQSLRANPAQLAGVTCDNVFAFADRDHDGRLDLDEFRAWYLSGERGMLEMSYDVGAGVIVPSPRSPDAPAAAAGARPRFTMAEVRRLARLHEVPVEHVLEVLADCVDADGHLTRRDVFHVARTFARPASHDDEMRLASLLDLLFDAFDYNNDGRVDFAEFAAGISVLCGGSSDEKIESAFALFDYNGDGYVYREEFELYVVSVLKVLYTCESRLAETDSTAGTSPEELTAQMSDALFGEDDDGDMRLSLAEFKEWFTQWQPGAGPSAAAGSPDSGAVVSAAGRPGVEVVPVSDGGHEYSSPPAQAYAVALSPRGADAAAAADSGAVAVSPPSTAAPLTLDELRRLTNLGAYAAGDVIASLHRAARGLPYLERFGFMSFFNRISGNAVASAEDASRRELVLERLFDLYESGSGGPDDTVDVRELACGVAMLCAGSREQKLAPAFAAFDDDNDGRLSMDELSQCLRALFTLAYEFDPDTQEVMDGAAGPVDVLADAAARDCFARSGARDSIDFAAFARWHGRAGTGLPSHAMAYGASATGAGAGAGPGAGAAMMVPPSPSELVAGTHNGPVAPSAVPMAMTLDMARRISGLSKVAVDAVMAELAKVADASGRVSRADFHQAMHAIIAPRLGHPDQHQAAHALLDRIFAQFDTRGLGGAPDAPAHVAMADFSILCSGLSVLCGGDSALKVRSTFMLYDVDRSGDISLNEMTVFLDAVFTVMYVVDAGMEARTGKSATQLARDSAAEAFEEADVNHDGRLSFPEFEAWFLRGSQAAAGASPTAPAATGAGAAVTLEEARRVTNLQGFHPQHVIKVFTARAGAARHLDRHSFHDCCRRLLPVSDDAERAAATFDALFDALDANGDGVVDLSELASGFTTLCGGSLEEKVDAAFSMYDLNGDGLITFDEMRSYLTSMFRVLYEAQDGTRDSLGVSPEELARVTAEHAFAQAGLGVRQELTRDDLLQWYRRSSPQSPSAATDGAAARAGGSAAAAPVGAGGGGGGGGSGSGGGGDVRHVQLEVVGKGLSPQKPGVRHHPAPQWLTVDAMSRLSGLCDYDVEDVFERLAGYVNASGLVTREAYETFFASISPVSAGEAAITESHRRVVLDRLFDAFAGDIDGVGSDSDDGADFRDLAAGMSVLCGSDAVSKLRAGFALNDSEGDGRMNAEVMTQYFSCVLRVLFDGFHDVLEEETSHDYTQLAAATAEQAFAEAGTDAAGNVADSLDYEAFMSWCLSKSDGAEVVRVAISGGTTGGALQALAEFVDLRRADAASVLRVFEVAADETGVLDRHAFFLAMLAVVDEYGSPVRSDTELQRLRLVLGHVFEMFASGAVDVHIDHIGSGLSVLCGGSPDAKIRAAFDLYDANGDGLISLPEMEAYLASVFTVIFERDPSQQEAVGVTAEDLASVTAAKCFEAYDTDRDGHLNFGEFRSYFLNQQADEQRAAASSSSAAPSAGAGADGREGSRDASGARSEAAAAAAAAAAGDGTSLSIEDADALREGLCLSELSVQEVFETFREQSRRGVLTRGAFERACTLLAALGGNAPENGADVEQVGELAGVVSRTFDVFDRDGNNVVDYNELASGLSVVAPGSAQDKVRAAFALWDTDSDGYLSIEELSAYLTAVFRSVFATNPGAREAANGVSAEELAAITAKNVFDNADTNKDGRLSFGEFERWRASRTSGGSL